jgi:hypothetical protein
VGCDEVLTCSKQGQWVDAGVGGVCEQPDGGNSPGCPADWITLKQGSQCFVSGAECEYSQAFCQCTVQCFGACAGPDSGIPTTWQCDVPNTPGGYCPIPRPRLGDYCASAPTGTQCDYGACTGNIAETCNSSGVWEQSFVACPGIASN